MNKLRKLIMEMVQEVLLEEPQYDRFSHSTTPHNSHSMRLHTMGKNPLTTDVGGHSTNDVVSQVSTFDSNGAGFVSNDNIVVSENRFTFYKVKYFGTTDIKSTMDLFGGNEKELRREIDRLNGAAARNGKVLSYRTITSEANANASKKSGNMINTFWEFSFDGGQNWYILKPKSVDNMKKSEFKV